MKNATKGPAKRQVLKKQVKHYTRGNHFKHKETQKIHKKTTRRTRKLDLSDSSHMTLTAVTNREEPNV